MCLAVTSLQPAPAGFGREPGRGLAPGGPGPSWLRGRCCLPEERLLGSLCHSNGHMTLLRKAPGRSRLRHTSRPSPNREWGAVVWAEV